MKSIIKHNKFFFLCLGALFIAGTILLWFFDKPELLLLVNQKRSPDMDLFFSFGTKLGEEIFYLIFATAFLFYRIGHGLLIGLIGFVVMGVSFLLKWIFSIDRPIAFLKKNDLIDQILFIDGIDVHSGTTSFPSGHSMSAFALYSLIIFLLPNKKRFVLPLLSCAVIVAISRVYLVQHFFIDIYFGSIIGALIALLLFYWYKTNIFERHDFLKKPIVPKLKPKQSI